VSVDDANTDDLIDGSDQSDPAVRADPHNPEQTLIGRQLGHALQRAVESLSPDHRAVVELAFAEDYSYQEISIALDCPVNTVKTRMFYARKHLAELLGGLERNTQTIARRNLS
jgi:RNA polymerase sigma factor (sigma-70 family)